MEWEYRFSHQPFSCTGFDARKGNVIANRSRDGTSTAAISHYWSVPDVARIQLPYLDKACITKGPKLLNRTQEFILHNLSSSTIYICLSLAELKTSN